MNLPRLRVLELDHHQEVNHVDDVGSSQLTSIGVLFRDLPSFQSFIDHNPLLTSITLDYSQLNLISHLPPSHRVNMKKISVKVTGSYLSNNYHLFYVFFLLSFLIF